MKYPILVFIMLLATGCKKDFVSPKVKTLYESVMKVHDEVMPEMSTLNKLKRGIKKGNGPADENLSLLKKIEDADEGMMSWMADFKLNRGASEADQIKYLEKEQVKIDKVSLDMKSIISEATTYLNTIKK